MIIDEKACIVAINCSKKTDLTRMLRSICPILLDLDNFDTKNVLIDSDLGHHFKSEFRENFENLDFKSKGKVIVLGMEKLNNLGCINEVKLRKFYRRNKFILVREEFIFHKNANRLRDQLVLGVKKTMKNKINKFYWEDYKKSAQKELKIVETFFTNGSIVYNAQNGYFKKNHLGISEDLYIPYNNFTSDLYHYTKDRIYRLEDKSISHSIGLLEDSN